jgi:DNA repair exonuclease SbcCD ATPase subunit
MILSIIVLALLAVGGFYLFFIERRKAQTYEERVEGLNTKYAPILNIDAEVATRKDTLNSINKDIEKTNEEYSKRTKELKDEFASKRQLYELLVKEVNSLEENLENISYGFYKPHYDYTTSEEFKKKLEQIREEQKDLIKMDQATHCPVEWQVGGSRREGERMVKQASKLMLRAFNGECDAAISKVRWNNISNMEARIEKAFEALNKLGGTNKISITNQYYSLKLKELYLEFEMEEKIHQEKEEQRRIKEQMREEEIALRELERVQKEAEDEEKRYNKSLEKARQEISSATGAKFDELSQKISELEENLRKAQEEKQRAISRAQLTKSGHVYIISNIGSFGEEVYKIGMTRRLEPMDRVRELGDASVPFEFDVHGIIYSENAPELENTLHRKFEPYRINLVNQRREFFKLTFSEIEKTIKEINLTIQLTKMAEAKEFRESLSIRDARTKPNKATPLEKLVSIPESL